MSVLSGVDVALVVVYDAIGKEVLCDAAAFDDVPATASVEVAVDDVAAAVPCVNKQVPRGICCR